METKKQTGFEKFMEKKNAKNNMHSFKGNAAFKNNIKNNQATRVRPSGNKV